MLRNLIFFVIYLWGEGTGSPAPLWIRAYKKEYILLRYRAMVRTYFSLVYTFKVSWIVVEPYSCHKATPCLGTNRE